MTIREQAIKALTDLPEEAGAEQMIRELSFLAGVEEARQELANGEGMNANEAKAKLREWI